MDSQVSQLGLLPESSEESDGEDDWYREEFEGAAATGAKPKRAGKLKSAKEAQVACIVRYPQLRALHSPYLCSK